MSFVNASLRHHGTCTVCWKAPTVALAMTADSDAERYLCQGCLATIIKTHCCGDMEVWHEDGSYRFQRRDPQTGDIHTTIREHVHC